MADFAGWLMRTIGPLLPENRIGRENLNAAFPEKSAAEIETILRGVWDNLGRMGAEFAHLDRLWDFDPDHPDRPSRIDISRDNLDRAFAACNRRQAGADLRRPSRQLGTAGDFRRCGKLDSAVLYRRPNIAASTAGCARRAPPAWAN